MLKKKILVDKHENDTEKIVQEQSERFKVLRYPNTTLN